MRRLRVIAVGQAPPPYGGQAVAIASFAQGQYERLDVTHVRMAFSDHMGQVGKLRLGKVVHLVGLIVRVLWARMRTRADVLYYPPAGPDLIPVVRDLVVLLGTRWAFRRTVFHFHAAGLSEVYDRLPRPLRPLFRAAYGRPDLTIRPSALNPPDGQFLGTRLDVVVPNGVPDAGPVARRVHTDGDLPVLLYVGVLRKSKGVLDLVEACGLLRQRGVDVDLHLVGQFESPDFEARTRTALVEAGIADRSVLWGVQTGADKLARMAGSDLFVYPSWFEAETFGLVVVEAMQAGLPVVATRWRGIASVVADGETGVLVPPRDPTALADAIQQLLADPERGRQLGRRGREVYLDRYTEEHYRASMEAALLSVEEPVSPQG